MGLNDRIEVSYAYQRFDTRAAGAALGLGRGFTFDQHVIGAKLRVVGDAVWDQDRWLPQIAVGVQYKIADRGAIIRAVGAREDQGADLYVAATKVFLAQSLVVNATVRRDQGQSVRPARFRRRPRARLWRAGRGIGRADAQPAHRGGRRIPHQARQSRLRARTGRGRRLRGLGDRAPRLR